MSTTLKCTLLFACLAAVVSQVPPVEAGKVQAAGIVKRKSAETVREQSTSLEAMAGVRHDKAREFKSDIVGSNGTIHVIGPVSPTKPRSAAIARGHDWRRRVRPAITCRPPFRPTEVPMLILSRKPGEQICIGSDVVLRVTQIKRGRVTVAIDAPQSVVVLRGELQSAPALAASLSEQAVPTWAT